MEPLLLAAGGMITYPASYLSGAAQLARKYGAHFILDEVATGFGRTGTMFARRQANITPDFLCLSKGITGGTLPLAATLTTSDVFEAFLGPEGSEKTFYHGHTYTANPAGCAAALASLDLFEEENTLDNVQERSTQLREGTEPMADLPRVGEVRHLGMMAALELVEDEEKRVPLPDGHEILREIYRAGLERNVILRPIGNVVYLFPPLCTTEDELSDMLDRAGDALDEVLRAE
jgi:adenosylmethionine-8-amino-7-oxononanoate aminotransferase